MSLPTTAATSYVIAPPEQPSLAVAGTTARYPVRRIWCVGRNYLDHIRELGNDEREPPFFFAKHADMVVPDGAIIPFPSLTNDLQFEVELVVALRDGGADIAKSDALAKVFGYAVGIDLTRRDLQIASRDKKQPWEVGKSFEMSAPIGAICPAAECGHPSHGFIRLACNGARRQDGDLAQMIWSVPEIIARLSRQVRLDAGDVIMTGTPAGVGRIAPGDTLDCEIENIGALRIQILTA